MCKKLDLCWSTYMHVQSVSIWMPHIWTELSKPHIHSTILLPVDTLDRRMDRQNWQRFTVTLHPCQLQWGLIMMMYPSNTYPLLPFSSIMLPLSCLCSLLLFNLEVSKLCMLYRRRNKGQRGAWAPSFFKLLCILFSMPYKEASKLLSDGLRNTLWESKIPNFPGGACPQTPQDGFSFLSLKSEPPPPPTHFGWPFSAPCVSLHCSCKLMVAKWLLFSISKSQIW